MASADGDEFTGEEKLVLELVRSSVEILRAARRAGYIDRALEWTGKPLDRGPAGWVKGFQAGIVKNRDDIEREVEFFRSHRVVDCIEHLGGRYLDNDDLIRWL